MQNEWNAKRALENWISGQVGQNGTNGVPESYAPLWKHDPNKAIPYEEWERALLKTAQLIERLGEEYLPIFRRVEDELSLAKRDLQTMEKIKQTSQRLPISDLKSNFLQP